MNSIRTEKIGNQNYEVWEFGYHECIVIVQALDKLNYRAIAIDIKTQKPISYTNIPLEQINKDIVSSGKKAMTRLKRNILKQKGRNE